MVNGDDILASIHETLASIPDPELPCSIVDLGLVEAVTMDDPGRVEITLLPTFTGCPALDMIADDVTRKVGELDSIESCHVTWIFDPPWTTDRITERGRDSLKSHGVTVSRCGGAPSSRTVTLQTSAIPCPWCGSDRTRLESPFGPTRCRSIHYCDACQNTFEDMKRLDGLGKTSTPDPG
ncbi:MAG: phenylacetate-CoA oxygenase subunit PaaJ [Phycisphaerae bacterium]|jgi:ring-1,2-phenylacetyl-CoA epoxidase subunit PaaD|nr:phenylacetate-CoA oxygenase subunit PaaJ [Phycisphaerae bacterium]|tara:strand:- start:2403 stop:2942 length:540 start_codon:yes stop_codon:yes gene_type:complete